MNIVAERWFYKNNGQWMDFYRHPETGDIEGNFPHGAKLRIVDEGLAHIIDKEGKLTATAINSERAKKIRRRMEDRLRKDPLLALWVASQVGADYL